MRVAILQFPGSNCDTDALHAMRDVLGVDAQLVWHKEDSLSGYDAVVLPGGFSYGDYLRCGAIARFSPVMTALKAFAEAGGPVIGICNGFQILCEAGLLPGALVRNTCLEFRCITSELIVEDSNELFNAGKLGERIRIPIAHGEGNYRIDAEGLEKLEANKQVLFRYAENPNGSLNDIAGIRSERGNVIGMMPHPERAVEPFMPSTDGLPILRAFLELAAVAT
ncbi:phosphoribosylformylglycinamidine synthase subunit PurQ [Ruficoccus sp. ZRK36]|uniref:phosphoribosylformylglycinamidine synthase subunit PurQ n=1 Tax=Ruficoccus sp. ZRK36 TaxID=2866311 RepID=UPI001C72A49F|nr:phosphoribosylformylglycinamidine synthase subunit PurQ [Ruficoccus sp. ZRK36]